MNSSILMTVLVANKSSPLSNKIGGEFRKTGAQFQKRRTHGVNVNQIKRIKTMNVLPFRTKTNSGQSC